MPRLGAPRSGSGPTSARRGVLYAVLGGLLVWLLIDMLPALCPHERQLTLALAYAVPGRTEETDYATETDLLSRAAESTIG